VFFGLFSAQTGFAGGCVRSVLVIDDEQLIRDLLTQALSLVDFKVETADNAKGGMAKFDSGLYDLVITDVQMPGVDGHGVVNHIRHSHRQETPVIGLSGTPGLLNGGDFDDVLPKPFAIQSLIEKAKLLMQQI
jgi:DNA-binding response OmpR family regulator